MKDMSEYTPFDYIKSASQTKQDLVKASDQPEYAEKSYSPHIVNKVLSSFEDSILHSNEMNRLYDLRNYAQYKYYLTALRPRQRFSKWIKLEKNDELDMVQQFYQCNRGVAKEFLKILTKENLETINKSMARGGHNV